MSRSWARGSTTAWRKLRLLILARDGYRCRIRIPGTCTGTATQVHHVHGKAVTGDDPQFLVAACRECNLKTGDPTKQTQDPKPQPRTQW